MLDSYQDTYRTGLWFEMGVVGLGMVVTSNLYSILSLSHVGVEFFQYPLLMDSNNSGFLGSE